MSDYMKGPWELKDEEFTDCGGYEAPAVFSVADPDNPKVVAYLAVRGEMEANGCLLAAAPELLNGCNALLGLIQLISANPEVPQFVKDMLNMSHRKAEAEAAIAKAEGR